MSGQSGHSTYPTAIEALGHPTVAAETSRALALQGRVLHDIASGVPLDAVLSAACRLVEELDPAVTTGILILEPDGQRFARALGASAPVTLLEALRDWPLQSTDLQCPCAAAILQNDIVFSSDIASDTRWSPAWRELMSQHALCTVLSYPIVDPFGTPLGTLFAARTEPTPDATRWNTDVLHIGARLAELALDREHCAVGSVERCEPDARDSANRRQRVEDTLTQMQRLEALGQLTAGVAHDFNNLLTVVLGNLDYLERHAAQWSTQTAQLARRLSFARLAAEHGAKLTAQLLAFSRGQQLEPKIVDVSSAISDMRLLLQSTLGRAIELQFELGSEVWPALVDPTQLELVLLNLAINARDAMPSGGRLQLTTTNFAQRVGTQELPPGDYVAVSVSDTGIGMSSDVLAHAFEPFFTTKAIGKGSGLGLAQVYGFAKQSGGGVRIESHIDAGTTVHIYLPRARHSPEHSTQSSTHPSIAGRHILLVDDDAAVRQVTQAMLTELGCQVDAVGDAQAVLALLRTEAPVDLLLADFAMPNINGVELTRLATELRPALPVVIVTGYAGVEALRTVPSAAVLQKPFRHDQLADKIRARLARGA